jgi:hypothetical protein
MTGHLPLVVLTGSNAESLHPLDQAGLDKVESLEGTIRLLGENQGDVL